MVEMVAVKEMLMEVAEEDDHEELVTELEWVVEVGGVVEKVVVMMITIMIMIFLNISIGGDSDWKILQSKPFKQ